MSHSSHYASISRRTQRAISLEILGVLDASLAGISFFQRGCSVTHPHCDVAGNPLCNSKLRNLAMKTDDHGLYIVDQATVITSVSPVEGHEGTIVTLKGTGFSKYVRNNCVVLGNLGACGRAQEGATSTELKVRIDPVAMVKEGDVMMWPGAGSNYYNDRISSDSTALRFSETAIFRNGAPIACAGVNFKLTKASPNTFGGELQRAAPENASLGGHEKGFVLSARIPKNYKLPQGSIVDVCLVLKEHPTLAVDFTAKIEGESLEHCLRAIAKSIVINGSHIGERIFADVVSHPRSSDFELCVTKPYLEKGLLTIHFNFSK